MKHSTLAAGLLHGFIHRSITNKRVNNFLTDFARIKTENATNDDWIKVVRRIVCNIKLSAEELIKSPSYDLDTLGTNVLNLKEGNCIDEMYESSENLLKLIVITLTISQYVVTTHLYNDN